MIPRLLLGPGEAFYCVKFVMYFIKANKLNSNKAVKIVWTMIEIVMSYLPCCTFKESLECLSVFLSELLGIFSNWN